MSATNFQQNFNARNLFSQAGNSKQINSTQTIFLSLMIYLISNCRTQCFHYKLEVIREFNSNFSSQLKTLAT